MLALLIFPVLIVGFLVCHIHPYYKVELHRYEGQFLYLKSAQLGSLCLLIALVLTIACSNIIPDKIVVQGATQDIPLSLADGLTNWFLTSQVVDEKKSASQIAWFLIISVNLFIAAYLYKIYGFISLMRRYQFFSFDYEKNAKLAGNFATAEILQDSPLDSLLFDLFLHKGIAMLTLNDRKVYVGMISGMGEPSDTNGIDQDVAIVPILSGYRAQNNLKVKFTTRYEEVDEDIELTLRQDAIISATEFNFNAYRTWHTKDNQSGHTNPG